MTIARKLNGKTLEIALTGKLNTLTAPELAADLKKNGLEGAENLFWDFSGLDYISSAGFRVLLVAQNMLEDPDNMKVLHANEVVQNAFSLTGQGYLLTDE